MFVMPTTPPATTPLKEVGEKAVEIELPPFSPPPLSPIAEHPALSSSFSSSSSSSHGDDDDEKPSSSVHPPSSGGPTHRGSMMATPLHILASTPAASSCGAGDGGGHNELKRVQSLTNDVVVSLSRMEFDFDAIEDEDSPYPEVRASVSNIDDPDMPAMTIRMWCVGLVLCMASR